MTQFSPELVEQEAAEARRFVSCATDVVEFVLAHTVVDEETQQRELVSMPWQKREIGRVIRAFPVVMSSEHFSVDAFPVTSRGELADIKEQFMREVHARLDHFVRLNQGA